MNLIKIFSHTNHQGLEKFINDWIKKKNIDVISTQISTTVNDYDTIYTVCLMYKQKEEGTA